MRRVTRVRTEQARRRSLWHPWFAWHPVLVSVDEEFACWVWLEHLERKWSLGRYRNQKGRWRYRYPAVPVEQPDEIPDGSSIVPED
jgi:hypothetical protein